MYGQSSLSFHNTKDHRYNLIRYQMSIRYMIQQYRHMNHRPLIQTTRVMS